MNIFRNPKWLKAFEYPFDSFDSIPQQVFDDINKGLDRVQSANPLVSIIISAWNEEVDILKTVGSLSKLKTDIPLEIIIVNNNSTDKTQNTLDKLHIKNYFKPIQG